MKLPNRLKSLTLASWRLLASAMGGLLAGYALPRANQSWLIFFSVALIVFAVNKIGFLKATGLGYVAGIFFYASQSTWMSAYLGPVPWLALAVLEGAIFAVGVGLISLALNFASVRFTNFGIWQIPATASLISFIWVAREWFAGRYPYGGYQWSRLAQTQADTWLAKWAYFGGLSLVSWVVCFISVTAVLVLLNRKRNQWLSVALVLLVAVTPLAINLPHTSGKTTVVAGVQGNANAGLFSNAEQGSILQKHLDETKALVNDKDFAKVDYVIWPENASDIDPLSSQNTYEQLHALVSQELNKPLVFGTYTWRSDRVYNSIMLFDPQKGITDWYDKKRPVPFAEYVPDRDFWNLLAPDLIGLIHHGYSSGIRSGVFNVAGVKSGSLICFELSIDDVLHTLINEDAEILISHANNADFGKTDETFQQASLAKLQAIATGRSIAHISTIGVSQVVLPDGSIQQQLEPFKPGYYIAEIPLFSNLTPAEKYFGWVDLLAGLTTIGFIIFSLTFKLLGARNAESSKS